MDKPTDISSESPPESPVARADEAALAVAPSIDSAEEIVEEVHFLTFLAALLIIVFVFRSFFLSPSSIPSESMHPRLLIGDYLLVNKMAYGYSQYSFPYSLPLLPQRIFARTPRRGDVAVFKAPPTASDDYIKRIIGVSGDRVEIRKGIVWLNGSPLPRERIEDFTIPVTANMISSARAKGEHPCFMVQYEERASDGSRRCRYPRYRETLPNGKSYAILDIHNSEADNRAEVVVPKGYLFMMGDNRDRSADSRFVAVEGGGIGLVPEEYLVGHALVTIFSTDGSAVWTNPISWATATRWERIGEGF